MIVNVNAYGLIGNGEDGNLRDVTLRNFEIEMPYLPKVGDNLKICLIMDDGKEVYVVGSVRDAILELNAERVVPERGCEGYPEPYFKKSSEFGRLELEVSGHSLVELMEGISMEDFNKEMQ